MAKQRILQEVIILREYLGLSWWHIAKQVCKCNERQRIAKTALSLYGRYKRYRYKQQERKEYDNKENMQDRDQYTGHPGFQHLSQVSVRLLPASYRDLKLAAGSREERHKWELLELVDYFYNKINLSAHDPERVWLAGLHKHALLVMQHINLGKANAQHLNSEGRKSASVEALAFIYVVFELTLSNTPFYHKLRELWLVILSFMPEQRRRRERKIRELITRIAELEAKVTKYKLALVASL